MASILTLEDQIYNELALKADSEVVRETEFNPFGQVERKKAQEISIATDIPVDEVEAQREAQDNKAEIIAKTQGDNFDYSLTIDSAYDDGLSAQEVAEIIQERHAKGEDMTLSDYVLLQNLMLSDNGVNSYAARTLTNMETFNKLIQQEIESTDRSLSSDILTFLDVNVLRELTLGAFENVTFRSNREGTEIREAFNSMKPD